MKRLNGPLSLALGMLAACATVSGAPQPASFRVALTPGAETPPCPSAGAGTVGAAQLSIPAEGTSIMASVTYEGLSGPVTAAHIHFGSATAPGPVVLSFADALGTPGSHIFEKTFVAADYIAAPGAPADFAAFVKALEAGGAAYVNVHTAACKGGEIRGEI
ncbi:MAG: CHRD domain-containing protein [Myxococcaceae bacterium]